MKSYNVAEDAPIYTTGCFFSLQKLDLQIKKLEFDRDTANSYYIMYVSNDFMERFRKI